MLGGYHRHFCKATFRVCWCSVLIDQVFTNWACAILGFAVADPSIITAENAARLRIPTDPPTESLVTALLSQVTKDVDLARRIFEVRASTQCGLTQSHAQC